MRTFGNIFRSNRSPGIYAKTPGRSLSAFVLALAVSGCTTGAVYEGARNAQRNQCLRLPETERQACLERIQDDYDTYKRKRDTTTTEPSP
jgi:hypothetical protein